MIQATKDQDTMGSGLLCIGPKTVSVGIHLKHVYKHMCGHRCGQKCQYRFMTTTRPDGQLEKQRKHASNQTLLWNVLPLMMQVL